MSGPVTGYGQTEAPAAVALDEEEYAVYAAIWQTDLFHGGLPAAALQEKTSVGYIPRGGQPGWSRRYARLFTYHTPYYASILRDFEAKNAQPALLERRLLPEKGWEFVAEHTPRDPDTRWGYFMLSRVGFNVDKTLALVYVGYRGATEVDYLLLFKRSEAGWVKVEQQLA